MTRPISKWVKVKTLQPRYGQRCLLFVKESGHIMDGYYYPHFEGGFATGRDRGSCIPGVTEWMPYPK